MDAKRVRQDHHFAAPMVVVPAHNNHPLFNAYVFDVVTTADELAPCAKIASFEQDEDGQLFAFVQPLLRALGPLAADAPIPLALVVGHDKRRILISTFTSRLENNTFTLAARDHHTLEVLNQNAIPQEISTFMVSENRFRAHVFERAGVEMPIVSLPISFFVDDHGSRSRSHNNNHKLEIGFRMILSF